MRLRFSPQAAPLAENSMNDTHASSEPRTVRKTVIDHLTGTTARLTALLVAVTALLTQVPLVNEATKSAYCQFATCGSSIFMFPDIVAVDGSRSKSGTMSKIQLSLIDNNGKSQNRYVAQWMWSGSGGTQGGNQTVIIDLKSAAHATVQSLKLPLDRAHCYYPGNKESHEGNLNTSAELITGIEVSVTPVEGPQSPC
jgi:hypothetical protein